MLIKHLVFAVKISSELYWINYVRNCYPELRHFHSVKFYKLSQNNVCIYQQNINCFWINLLTIVERQLILMTNQKRSSLHAIKTTLKYQTFFITYMSESSIYKNLRIVYKKDL